MCYALVTVGQRKEAIGMTSMTTAMYANTAAHAQDTCAASACSAANCIILILDVSLLLASIILLPIFSGMRTTVHRSHLCRAQQAA